MREVTHKTTHVSYDSVHTNCPEKMTLWSQKVGRWSPRAGAKVETDWKKSQENLWGGRQKCSKAGLKQWWHNSINLIKSLKKYTDKREFYKIHIVPF